MLNLFPVNRMIRINSLKVNQWKILVGLIIKLIYEVIVGNFITAPVVFFQVVEGDQLSESLGVHEHWLKVSLMVANGLHDQETQNQDDDCSCSVITKCLRNV